MLDLVYKLKSAVDKSFLPKKAKKPFDGGYFTTYPSNTHISTTTPSMYEE
jgi:hypothetical protein